MNLECLSNYFDLLKFLSTILYSFQSLNFAFSLLFIYKYFIVFNSIYNVIFKI